MDLVVHPDSPVFLVLADSRELQDFQALVGLVVLVDFQGHQAFQDNLVLQVSVEPQDFQEYRDLVAFLELVVLVVNQDSLGSLEYQDSAERVDLVEHQAHQGFQESVVSQELQVLVDYQDLVEYQVFLEHLE